MDLYGQDPELRLLGKLVTRLDRRTMIDVGAEKGGLAEAMLDAGVEELYACDPHPHNASSLRTRFADDPRVTVHEYAISDGDGSAELHVSTNPDGSPRSFSHTLLERADTDEVAWKETVNVTRRSLQSLIDAGELPSSTGILKIDTEGHDLAVVRGMGALQADIVMVEHWTELPHSLGTCPWTIESMVAELDQRGFSHFAFVVHREEFVTLKWDDGQVERGAMGNLIFLHDRTLPRLLPDVLDCAGWLAERAVRVGQTYMRAARDRLALVDELTKAADARLQALETTSERLKTLSAEVREA